MPRFILQSSIDLVLSKLFTPDSRERTVFGWSAVVVDGKVDTIATKPVRISDYIMEGGVRYTVQIQPHPKGCELVAIGMGGNRDQYIQPAVRHYIQAVSIPIVEEYS
jgi:hypothetical protein